MAAPRVLPSTKRAIRNAAVPMDTTGMDPEMAKTLEGEKSRVTEAKMMYAPASIKKPAASGVKKQGLLDSLMKKIRGK